MKTEYIREIITGKRPFKDVLHYLLGNYRYKLYYSKNFRKLIRKHIFEQIKWRIDQMDRQCFYSGSCKHCGCETTALQMANKSCEEPCYPEMMTRKEWLCFRAGLAFRDKNGTWLLDLTNNKTKLIIRNGICTDKSRIGLD